MYGMTEKKIPSLIQGNKPDSCTPSGKIFSHFPWDFGRLSMRKFYPLTFQAEKLLCLQPRKFSSHFSWQSKRQLSGKIFIPSLVQRKKSYSWQPKFLIVYKKLIYPFTYTRKFIRHPTTKFQKVSSLFKPKNQRHYARAQQKIFIPLLIQRKNRASLCADKTKKTYTYTHNETRDAVCIPASSYCACMYKSLNCPFCISIFIPQPRGCFILTQRFLFVQSEWKNIFLCLLWSRF